MPMTPNGTLSGGVDPTEEPEETDPAHLAAKIGRTGHSRNQEPARPPGPDAARQHGTSPPVDLLDVTARLLGRPSWHAVKPPGPVAEAWDKVKTAVDRADDIAVQLAQLDADYRRESSASEQAVLEAMRQGKKPPAMPNPDTHGQSRADLLARHRAAFVIAGETRTKYNAVVAEELADWRASLIADFAELQPAAREAWQQFQSALGAWRNRISVIDAMTEQAYPSAVMPARTSESQRLGTQLANGLATLDTVLGSNDADVNGNWVTEDPTLDPPMHLRRYWLSIGQAGWVKLADVERAEREEGKVVSTFLIDIDGRDLDPRTGRPTAVAAGA